MSEAAIEAKPRRPRIGPEDIMARAARAVRVGWYAGLATVSRRSVSEATPGEPARRYRFPAPAREDLARAFRQAFTADDAAVKAGLYPAPRRLDWREAGSAFAQARAYLRDLPAVARRRAGGQVTEVRDLPAGQALPPYYRQNFHYQSGGWLTRDSADIYDTQVEVLFTGSADAMRRVGLEALGQELKTRTQRDTRVLDVACGAGRFLEQMLEAFPRLRAEGLDLSEAYLDAAKARLGGRRVTLHQANAEATGLAAGGYDVLTSVYLFHELPPRVRPEVAKEIARLLKPGGLFIFADSLQYDDDAPLNRLLEAFPQSFHEPYYDSYCREDFDALFGEAGLTLETSSQRFLTKMRAYRKLG
ncbi:MAG: class I SAM-dependent methyltransferase [Maricaulaceae bacterium]